MGCSAKPRARKYADKRLTIFNNYAHPHRSTHSSPARAAPDDSDYFIYLLINTQINTGQPTLYKYTGIQEITPATATVRHNKWVFGRGHSLPLASRWPFCMAMHAVRHTTLQRAP